MLSFPTIVQVEKSSDPENETGVFRNATHPSVLIDGLLTEDIHQCWDLFKLGCRIDADRQCVGTRSCSEEGKLGEYNWTSYREVAELSVLLGLGLRSLNLIPSVTFMNTNLPILKCVGIYCRNRLEWLITEQAANIFNFVLVPFYSTLGHQALAHIIWETELETIIISHDMSTILMNVLKEYFPSTCKLLSEQPNKNKLPRLSRLKHLIVLPETPCVSKCYFKTDISEHHTFQTCTSCTWSSYSTQFKELVTLADTLGLHIIEWKNLIQTPKYMKVLSGFRQVNEFQKMNLNHWVKPIWDNDICLWENIISDCTRDSIQSICYTSGTTGIPKGVLISQLNIISVVCGAIRGPFSQKDIHISQEDCHLSYLPLAHIYERVIINLALVKGAQIGMFSGNVQNLLDDIAALKPTVFVSVPRVFMKINDKILSMIRTKSWMSQYFFHLATQLKIKRYRKNPLCLTHTVWDMLIFNKLRLLLGGRVRYLLVGGACLDVAIQEKIAVYFSTPLLQGYGLTEVMGAAFNSYPSNPCGFVGSPFPVIEFKLQSVPELNYFISSKDTPRGELCLRGPSVTKGYFRNIEETQNLFLNNDWLRTGDIAELHQELGLVKIIDRRKNIFKLSQGEYVAVERLECIYSQVPIVEQIYITGKATKSYLVALIVPNEGEVIKWFNTANQCDDNSTIHSKVCENMLDNPIMATFRNDVLMTLSIQAKESGLQGFERIADIWFLETPFTVENGLLTPTLKVRRLAIESAFKQIIDSMYKRTDVQFETSNH